MNSKYSKYEPIFNAWYIRKKLGEGSFGEVYEIVREDFGKNYRSALKVISIPRTEDEIREMKAGGSDETSIASYYRGVVSDIAEENAIMADLKGHSNIVSYEDHTIIPHEDGIGYDILIRMELLTSLTDHLMKHSMSEDDVIKLGIDLCTALEICSQKNILHRDIKPGNIFISDIGDYKLGDFGISRTVEKATTELSKKGTFAYMAPEVYRGDTYGPQADIYSLGIVMYYLMNRNRTPLLPPPPNEITHHQRMDAVNRRMNGAVLPFPSESSPELASIILRACAFEPAKRFASASQLREALEELKRFREGRGSAVPGRRSAAAGSFAGDEYRTQLLEDLTEDATDRDVTLESGIPFSAAGMAAASGGYAGHGGGHGPNDPGSRAYRGDGFGRGAQAGAWSSDRYPQGAQSGSRQQRQAPPAGRTPAGAGGSAFRKFLSSRNGLIAVIAAVAVFSGLIGFLVVNAITGSDDDTAQTTSETTASEDQGGAETTQPAADAAEQRGSRIVSHKGTDQYGSPNTMGVFEWAADKGSKYIEMDAVLSGDSLYATNNWSDFYQEGDKDGLTSLDEVVERLDGDGYDGTYVIELKTHGNDSEMVSALIRLADDHRLRSRIIAESFDAPVLGEIKSRASDIRTMGLCDTNSDHEGNETQMVGNPNVDIVAVDATVPELMAVQSSVQSGGQEFGTWEPGSVEKDDPNYVRRMLNWGVDYIFTYYTDKALQTKKDYEGGN